MAELREFQKAAVDRIVDMLNSNNSGRYLLADEVGLGKTLIAQGVVQRLSERRKRFTVVYLCSNLEIAAQNAEKLAPSDSQARALKDRLTLMTLGINKDSHAALRIYSFTPGTSLELGRSTGIKRERRLLLYLVSQGLGKTLTKKWREFFKCGPTISDWEESTTLPKLKAEFESSVHGKFLARWTSLVGQSKVDRFVDDKTSNRFRTVRVLDECIDEYSQYDAPWITKNRNAIVGALRKSLALASLDYLAPDLVIMDEFQRFKQVLKQSRHSDSLESKLLSNSKCKVLILSATPYKMYTLQHETEDHHKDFLDTFAFLNSCELADPKVTDLKTSLDDFRTGLEEIKPTDEVDQELLEKKCKIETVLQQVMCRTERNRYINDSCKGITELPADGENTRGMLPKYDELRQYVELSQFLLQDPKRAREHGRKVLDYWKSGPSLLSFMDGHYALIKTLRDNQEEIPKHLLLNVGKELKQSHKYNQKFRLFFEDVFRDPPATSDSSAKEDWPFLWIKPFCTYYQDTFYEGRPLPQKFLVFSHWHFVPKTVAFLTSSELERRLQFRKHDFKSSPLTFKKGLMSVFNVAIPSLALASLIDPVQIAAGFDSTPDQRQVERVARQRLLAAIQKPDSGITYSREGVSSNLWHVVARLEGTWCDQQGIEVGDQLHTVISNKQLGGKSTDSASQKWLWTFQRRYAAWLSDSYSDTNKTPINVNERTLRKLVHVALYSPAVCVLRSLLHSADSIVSTKRGTDERENLVDLLEYVARIGCGQLRNYFNRPLVQAIIGRSSKGSRYTDKVLDYCGRAHLQAVIDEYVYLQIGNINGDETKSTAEKLVDQIGVVFSMHAGSPRVNNRVNNKLKTDATTTGSAHFALAFGDDSQVESETVGDFESRKSDVRTAFNSPFWPFVLATTSVGQEGLDFHLYCKDIVHWNLPSNPVDLEQREGRLNRYNCYSIREMISRDFPLTSTVRFNQLKTNPTPAEKGKDSTRGLPWQWIFDSIEAQPLSDQSFKQGLYPHWIYVPREGKLEILRRHLLFYSNSKDSLKYKRLKRDLALYRLVFGQPRQEDIVRKIRERLGDEVDGKLLHEYLPIYMINLSPFTREYTWEAAKTQARRLLSKPKDIEALVLLVRLMQERYAQYLGCTQTDIDTLVAWVSSHAAEQSTTEKTTDSVAALYYLANPYDGTFDFFRGVGLTDDLGVIRDVITKHFAT
ncbi:DEAD/DEAH box helicase family protein [Pirellulaceae bacterium SH449]